MTKKDISKIIQKRREWVWNEWQKINKESKKPISLKKRARIYKKLNRKAKRKFK